MKKRNQWLHATGGACLVAGLALTSAVAQACSAIPFTPPPLPAGPDGKLPVTYPDTVPPKFTFCPVNSYGTTASLPSLTDGETDKLGITGNVSNTITAPAWDSSKVYNGGELVSYNGQIYKAQWWTQNETPGNGYGVWAPQASSSAPQAWDATRVYNTDDKAVYQGDLYRAKWWTQGNTPGEQWGAWENLGPAPTSSGRPAPYQVQVQQETKATGEVVLHVSYLSYQPHQQIRYVATNDCTVAQQTSYFGNGSSVPPERWEVRIDGKVVTTVDGSQFDRFPARPLASLPPDNSRFVMRDPNGQCLYTPGTTLFTWDGFNGVGTGKTVTIPKGPNRWNDPTSPNQYLSTWSCNGDACRPTTLLWHTRMGTMAWNR